MITTSPRPRDKAAKDRLVKNRLAFLREAAGLSQTELARRVGVQAHSISNIERGIYGISDDTALLICKVLECSSIDLLYIDPAPLK